MSGAGLLRPGRVVKLVLSATLTRDPNKIDRLGLHCPRYIATSATEHRYVLPKQLKEWRVVCRGSDKPKVLAALLRLLVEEASGGTIVFTSSVEATHRLFLLLEALAAGGSLPGVQAVEYSSLVDPSQRSRNLELFRDGKASVACLAGFRACIGRARALTGLSEWLIAGERAGLFGCIHQGNRCATGRERGQLRHTGVRQDVRAPSRSHRPGRTGGPSIHNPPRPGECILTPIPGPCTGQKSSLRHLTTGRAALQGHASQGGQQLCPGL